MTNIRRIALTLLIPVALFTPLAACGSPAQTSQRICLGPETPDDLEDLFDRDIVRHPDAACLSGDPLFGFETVSSGQMPSIGEEVGDTAVTSHYRSSHSRYLHDSRSRGTRVYVIDRSRVLPGSPLPAQRSQSPLPRSSPLGAPVVPSRANSGPTAAPVPSRSSSVTRGGLGVPSAPRVSVPAAAPAPRAPIARPAAPAPVRPAAPAPARPAPPKSK